PGCACHPASREFFMVLGSRVRQSVQFLGGRTSAGRLARLKHSNRLLAPPYGMLLFHCSSSKQKTRHELHSPSKKCRPRRNSTPFFRLAFSSTPSNHVTLRPLPAARSKCAGPE